MGVRGSGKIWEVRGSCKMGVKGSGKMGVKGSCKMGVRGLGKIWEVRGSGGRARWGQESGKGKMGSGGEERWDDGGMVIIVLAAKGTVHIS